jgi:hypothetical protein
MHERTDRVTETRAADHIEGQVRPDVDARNHDQERQDPDDPASARAQVWMGRSGESCGNGSVSRDEAQSGGRIPSDDDRREQLVRARPFEDLLEDPRP